MYQEIFTIWKEERRSTEIIEIPPDFYNRAADYLSHLDTMSKTEKDPLISRLFNARKQRVLFMLQDLTQIRIKKIVTLILETKEIPKRKLTVEELKFTRAIEKAYNTFIAEIYRIKPPLPSEEKIIEKEEAIPSQKHPKKEKIQDISPRLKSPPSAPAKTEQKLSEESSVQPESYEEESEGIEYSYVLIIKEFPKQFVGIDLAIYGPFIKDSIVYLPKENADFLNRTGIAEYVTFA